jgi:hypothetical protein
MPHIHMLITLDEERLRISPDFVDNLISAENVPEPAADDHSEAAKQARKLRSQVGVHQLHTCSDTCCLKDDGTCEKRFPREYSNETILSENFTQYKRRHTTHGGSTFIGEEHRGVRNIYTNQSVVPYNQFLLLKYESHHDIEWVGSQQRALEYCLKYLLKGEFGLPSLLRPTHPDPPFQAMTWLMCRSTTRTACPPAWSTTTK